MDSLQWIQQLHLIRPYWLLALLPLALIIWLAARTQSHSRSWASVIDKRLLPHLLKGVTVHKKNMPIKRLFLLGFIVIFALAGPAFEKRPQAVFKTQSALVILLDLSRSMDATDIKPSRLSRAHFKINDILSQRKEGQTALIAYAANAYVVSPLTDDANTISSQVPALETYIMPAQGSRLDIALNKAAELFTNAGQSSGDVLVITDSVSARDNETIKQLRAKNISTSFLAIGTEEGAPIADHNGGFVKDNNGSIVVPKLDSHKIKRAALVGAGKFSLLTPNDRDISYLLPTINKEKSTEQADADGNKFKTDIWHEEGPWLLLIIIPFAAYVFRKGLIFALLIFILPLPQPAQAASENSWDWSKLWRTQDQQAAQILQQGDTKQAAKLFNHPQWKAAAQYKSGEYEKSVELLNNIDTSDANYNRGNALAKLNDLENSIKAYDRALQLDPNNEDAKYNKQLVEEKLQENKKQNSQNNNSSQDNQEQQPGSDSQQQNQSADNNSDSESQQNNQSEQPSNESSEDPAQLSTQLSTQQSTQQSAEQSDKLSEEQKNKMANTEESDQTENKESSSENKTAQEIQAEQQRLSEATPDLEQQQAQQWLKKIPDDPGGLLRRKFKYQYSREKNQHEQQPW